MSTDNTGGGGSGAAEPQIAEFNPEIHESAAKEYFEKKGFVVKSPEEINASVEAEASNASKNAHDSWENAMAEAIGSKRPDGVKGIDWVKSQIAALKEAKKADGSGSNPEKDGLIKELTTQLNELKSGLETKEKNLNDVKINTAIDYALDSITFGGANEKETASRRESVNDLVRGRYKYEIDPATDKPVAVGKDGKWVMDISTGKPKELSKLFKEDIGWALPKDAPKPSGTGTQQNEVNKDGVQIFSDKDSIFAKAREMGLRTGSTEWKEFTRKSAEASKVSLTD